MANISLKDIQFPGLNNVYKVPEVDNTLTQSGAAADAKKTGDELSDLKQDLEGLDVYTLGLYPQMSVADTAVASFTDGADNIPVKSLTVDITPVQSGTGDPSPENVRPISGWAGANVIRCGKNLLNISKSEGGGIDASGVLTPGGYLWRTTEYISVEAGTTYTFSANTNMTLRLYYYDTNKNFIERVQNAGSASLTVTIPQGTRYIKWTIYDSTSTLDLATVEGFELQIENGSSASDYEAYKGTTYEVDWTTEAGTVYGGTLDVTNGVLTVDRQMVTFNGSEGWTLNSSGSDYSSFYPDAITDASTPIVASWLPYNASTSLEGIGIRTTAGGRIVCTVPNSIATTASGLKTYLTTNNLSVVYTKTPVTYQLEETAVNTILGQNNIFADTGDIAELTYRADLKAYIDEKLA